MTRRVKIKFNAPVILSFVMICLIVTLLGVITDNSITKAFFTTYHSSLMDPLTYVRFFTHIFGHADLNHFMSNAIYLLLLGPLLEEKYGSVMIVKTIMLTALVTGFVNYILFWNVGLCGASGVVFAFVVLSSFTSFSEGEIPVTFILIVIIFIGQQIVDGLAMGDNISQLAHIIGGLVGAIVGYRMNKKN